MQVGKPSKSWDAKSSASFWLNRASKSVQRVQDGRLRPLGFGVSQIPVLYALGEGAALSQKELAQRAQVEQPTMAEMLARMERDSVVQREPNPNDKRGSLTSLTRRSRARLPNAKAALVQVEQQVTAGFSASERALLVSLLERVVSNLEGAASDCEP